MEKRVLYIAYQFPPVGGAGVQRSAKFVKYLPRCGWLPSVLTVANPSVPLYDEVLAAEVPEQVLIRRARTWEPGYAVKAAVAGGGERAARPGRGAVQALKGLARGLGNALLQPDPQILWLPDALRVGGRLLREAPHSAVVVSAPPFSGFLVGAALSRRARLPLVLDYRDEWGISNTYWENKRLGPFARFVQGRMQRGALRGASALVATTRSSAESLERARAAAGSKARVTWIYNGFDPDDFAGPAPPPPPDTSRYRLAYVGTLWNLTSVEPLVDAALALGRSHPDLGGRLDLVFAGRRTPAQQQILDRLQGASCRLVQHPYLNHQEALDLLRTADGLLVLLSGVPGAERVVPAKIFEYAATGRPILVVAPRGEVWDLLHDYPAVRLCPPQDVAGITQALAEELRRHQEGRPAPTGAWDPSPFDRRHQARQLADLLDSVVAARGRPAPPR